MTRSLGMFGGMLTGGGESWAERPEFGENITLCVQYAVLIITTSWTVDSLSGSDDLHEFLIGLFDILNLDGFAEQADTVIPRLRDSLECIEALAAGTDRIEVVTYLWLVAD